MKIYKVAFTREVFEMFISNWRAIFVYSMCVVEIKVHHQVDVHLEYLLKVNLAQLDGKSRRMRDERYRVRAQERTNNVQKNRKM